MGWYGTHPTITREEARKILPPGACKRCVYYTRCFPEKVSKHRKLMFCSRCESYTGAYHVMDTFGTPMLTPHMDRCSDHAMYRQAALSLIQQGDRLVDTMLPWI